MAMVMDCAASASTETNRPATLTLSAAEHLTLAEARVIAETMARAADQGEPRFLVKWGDVLERLAEADELHLVRASVRCHRRVRRFSLPPILPLPQGLVARYVCGILIHPNYQRHGVGGDLLGIAGCGVDVVVGHSQNPHVSRRFGNGSSPGPTPMGRRLRRRSLRHYASISNRLAANATSIGFPESFAICMRDLYTTGRRPDFHPLTSGGDGLLLLGFTSQSAYAEAVDAAGGNR